VGISTEEAGILRVEAQGLARDQGDMRSLAVLETVYAQLKGFHNDFDEMVACGERAVRLAEEAGEASLQLAARVPYVRALLWLARWDELLEVADQGLQVARGDPSLGAEVVGISPYLWLILHRAAVLGFRGHPVEAIEEFESAIRLAQRVGDLEMVPILCLQAIDMCQFLGDGEKAMNLARVSQATVERVDMPLYRVWNCCSIGVANAMNGEWSHAIDAFEEARSISAEAQVGGENGGFVLQLLSEARLNSGDGRRALEEAEHALDFARTHRQIVPLPWIHHRHGRVLLRTLGVAARERAEEALQEAEAMTRSWGFQAFDPLILLERAELARLLGDDTTWERGLHEAHRLFTEMGATGHAERVARELGLEGA
jgi:tetratricopeptide (TPR) repeat protein